MQILRPEDRKRRRLAYWLVMGGGGPRGLIGNGTLSAPLTLTRAQAAGVQATGLTNIGWQTYGANVPRFVLPNGGLLIGGQRSNGVRNPRGEGAVVGAPGTPPTNWIFNTPAAGLSREILSTVVQNGVLCQRIRYSGTASSGLILGQFEGNNVIAAVNGETWTQSAFVGLEINSGATPEVRLSNRETAADGTTNTNADTTGVNIAASLTTQAARFSRTTTLSGVGTAFTSPALRLGLVTSTAYDFTLIIGWPQMELGAFASTPILPPVGTPGASTRGGDIVTAPLSSLGMGGNGACTVLWRGAFDATNIGNSQIIAAVDDGGSNRYDLRLVNSGIPEIFRVTGGVTGQQSFGGAPPTPGAVLRAGMCIDGAGRLASVVQGYNGGAALNVTGGPTSGLTTLRVGNNFLNTQPLWGTTERMQVLPRVVSDAELAALVATF